MEKTYYTKSHEWLTLESENSIKVGITKYAIDMLGDLVFIDLPKVGSKYSTGDVNIVIESVKAASDIYSPLDCEVTEVNPKLDSDLSTLSSAPETDGWIYKAKLQSSVSNLSEFMSLDQYKVYCGQI